IEAESRAARDLDRLRGDRERAVLQAVAASTRPVVAKLADYLEAAAAPEKNAEGRQLDAERVSAWTAHIRKAAADPKDPIHAYAVAVRGGDLAKLAAKQRERMNAGSKALENVNVIVDY